MKKSKKSTFIKILGLVKQYKLSVVSVIFLAALSVVLTLYIPIIIGEAIDLAAGKGKTDLNGIWRLLIKGAAVIIATGVINHLISTLNNRIAYGVVKNLRMKAFTHLQKLPLSYIDTHPYGDTVSRIISDADTFSEGLLLGFTQLFTGVMTIAVTIIFMLSINVYIALVVIVLTPISLLVSKYIASKTHAMFTLQSQTRGEQTAIIQEAITNQKVIQSLSSEKETLKRFDEINEKLGKYSLKATFFSSLVNPTTRFVNSLVYALVALFGAMYALKGGALTVGGLSCFLSYANQYTKPFNEISGVIAELHNAIACAERIFELTDAPVQSPDGNISIPPEDIFGSVNAHGVYFSYVPERPLIQNLNLNITPGQQIAIVGPTGCGKTTLINLLMRFYDVNDGSIRIDGININDLTRESLRSGFGMVLQDTWLKTGTVRENIALANPDATDEQITEAAKKAHAHSFIKRLPKGYDTVLTANGSGLSQGEKQLLCIARLMLTKPHMLILDEATSSIDTRTEMKIQSAFSTLMKGHTSFVVAHRLSTIKNADRILVMKDGNVVEQGTHNSLMEKGGFYYDIYNSQFKG
ncbi:MAG: ABC transporter ATP-binding protein [Clostridia bacterium]|nr:ABC transporter ATP-binding protein [Clostridia bacterium]